MIFWVFGMLIAFRRMVVENSVTSHFTQNFALSKMESLESNLNQDFVYLKTAGFTNLTHSQWFLMMKILEKGRQSNFLEERLKIRVGE